MADEQDTNTEQDDHTLSVQIANQIVNVANARLEEGLRPDIISTGLRHAAANFSAFVAQHMDPDAVSEGRLTDEFHRMLEYYAHLHSGKGASEPATGLHDLVNRVKDEF